MLITNARLANRTGLFNIACEARIISIDPVEDKISTKEYQPRPISLVHTEDSVDANGNIALPALSHAHLHLDKCFLLDHCDSQLQDGTFAEALQVTDAAKRNFNQSDLLERGNRLLQESSRLGVTSARCHVEVDDIVGFSCLCAGQILRERFENELEVQLAVFAQNPIFTESDPEGVEMKRLLTEAATRQGVEVIGSAPYVEATPANALKNAKFIIELAARHKLHIDFHIDYNIDIKTPAMIFEILDILALCWADKSKSITFGHATRMTLFDDKELLRLAEMIKLIRAEVHFVGLPLSDMHMMGRDNPSRPRGTLQCVDLINRGFNCASAINNAGNAFTPIVNTRTSISE